MSRWPVSSADEQTEDFSINQRGGDYLLTGSMTRQQGPSMTPRKPRANPATKAEDADKENEDSEDRVASISGKGLRVMLPISRRSGEVLIYALSFALVVGVVGLVVAQIIEAFRMSGVSIKESAGFVLWLLITFLCALGSRS